MKSDYDKLWSRLCLSEKTPAKYLSAKSAVSSSEQPFVLPFKE